MLKEAALREPDNPFVTYQLAHALYKTQGTKPRSYSLYRRLITQLDAAAPADAATLNIDVWFVEAYWRLGALYMANEQWPEAQISIARSMLAANKDLYDSNPLHKGVLNYLTEYFYQLGDAAITAPLRGGFFRTISTSGPTSPD